MIFPRSFSWKATVPLALATACTFVSFMFQFLVVEKLGVGGSSDLYYAGTIISLMLYTVVFDPLNSILIPMFVEKSANQGEDVEFFWSVLFVVFSVGLLILLICYYPALVAFHVLFKRIAAGSASQVGAIFIAFCIYQIIYSAVAVKNCLLYSHARAISAQIGLLLGWVASILARLSQHRPIVNLSHIAYCLVFGNIVALVFPNFDSLALPLKLSSLRRHAVELGYRASPVLIGSAPYKAETLVDGAIASLCGVGGVTIYYLFGRLILSIATVLHLGYIQPETKKLADLAQKHRGLELRERAKITALRCAVLSCGLLIPIVLLLFGSRFISATISAPYLQAFEKHSWVLVLMVGYLIGMQIFRVYANALFVLGREKSFAVIGIACFAIGVFFKLAGAYWLGLAGLAAGTSAYWLFYAFAIVFAFLNRLAGCTADSDTAQRIAASSIVD